MNPRRATGQVGILVLLAILILSAIVVFGVYALWQLFDRKTDAVIVHGLPPAAGENSIFRQVWKAALNPPLALQMAPAPGRDGEFLVLNHEQVFRFNASGELRGKFQAPDNTSRIAADSSGLFRYVLLVSSTKKWTGAIDYMETTGYFLSAVDLEGKQAWKLRFEPKEVSSLDPVLADVDGARRPLVVLSASKQVFGIDSEGRIRWSSKLWHHPQTLSATDLDGDGKPEILVALAPGRGIARLDAMGRVQDTWAASEPLQRFAAVRDQSGLVFGASLRQVFGTNLGGVRFAITFFNGAGQRLQEVILPANVHTLSYAPLAPMNAGGQAVWVTALSDGSFHVFSPDGSRSASHNTGARLRSMFVLEQPGGDLLILGDHRGLTAWKVTRPFR